MPFNEKLFNKNIRFISDLYNGKGTPLTQKEVEDIIRQNIMFTVYIGIWKAIPKNWKEYLLNMKKEYDTTRPINIEWITKDKKGTENIRKALHMGQITEIPKGQEK